ncbi:unnamed protein product [Rotaria sp. Silwood1]|nr:unnamed protein product [Rotaria sp. Silwood1]CAF3955107.1 unnamed protein product [Rotaria sp. Silwood1]CAF5016211.1 unnamed protein product [Rotaria sp. Silwood1]CAF5023627.1 unnamed protein product [Rotaria sp. Silwood1]CAF5028538.1 unnamed protein product [Rotaria sp. Silwood1]
MLSDECFSDESLDKYSPIRPSDRILRSASVSSTFDGTILTNLDLATHSMASVEKEKIIKVFVLVSASNHEMHERSSQIFDVNHLRECMHSAHICPGDRLELIIDTERNSGLFHNNGLQCSVCNKITDFTNFPRRPLYQLQIPNERLYAASAISGIGYDATHFVLSVLGINTPHRSNFYKQVHHL